MSITSTPSTPGGPGTPGAPSDMSAASAPSVMGVTSGRSVTARWSSRSHWLLLAGLALLVATAVVAWRETHPTWQDWQARYNAEPGVTPIPIGIRVIVPTLTGKPELCTTCHVGIEDISPSHPVAAFGCVICHGGERLALDAATAHSTLRGGKNPSDLSVAQASCGTSGCHGGYANEEQNHVDRVTKSLQATYAGGIAAARFAFGAQSTQTAIYGLHAVADASTPLPANAVPSLQALPTTSVLSAIDAQLQQNCLTGGCHLSAAPPQQPYYYRSTGCAACHYLYNNDGLYKGTDPTIPKDQVGHGAYHRLTTAIPYTQCDHCHNRGNYAWKGLQFNQRDDLPPAGPALSPDTPPEVRRLLEYYQPISEFTKCEVELNCVDCHTAQEVMGDGHIYSSKKDVQYIQCQTCHGTPTSTPKVALITDPNELAMRQARIDGRSDFLAVGDAVIQTDRGELLWSVKEISPSHFVQIDKVSGKVYDVPLVAGSKCTQDGSSQSSDYCHKCHSVTR